MRIGNPLAVAPHRSVDHLDLVARKADHPLYQIEPAFARRLEHDDIAVMNSPEMHQVLPA